MVSEDLHGVFHHLLLENEKNQLGRMTTINDNGEEEDQQNFLPAYDEFDAMKICRILLERGASPHGNPIYEMRPLHIAIRREWQDLTELLLQAGKSLREIRLLGKHSSISGANPNLPERDIYASRPMDIAVLNDDPELVKVRLSLLLFHCFLHSTIYDVVVASIRRISSRIQNDVSCSSVS